MNTTKSYVAEIAINLDGFDIVKSNSSPLCEKQLYLQVGGLSGFENICRMEWITDDTVCDEQCGWRLRNGSVCHRAFAGLCNQSSTPSSSSIQSRYLISFQWVLFMASLCLIIAHLHHFKPWEVIRTLFNPLLSKLATNPCCNNMSIVLVFALSVKHLAVEVLTMLLDVIYYQTTAGTLVSDELDVYNITNSWIDLRIISGIETPNYVFIMMNMALLGSLLKLAILCQVGANYFWSRHYYRYNYGIETGRSNKTN